MSAAGEKRAFEGRAKAIAKRLRTDRNLTATDRAQLERDLAWYNDEAGFCAGLLRQEERYEQVMLGDAADVVDALKGVAS